MAYKISRRVTGIGRYIAAAEVKVLKSEEDYEKVLYAHMEECKQWLNSGGIGYPPQLNRQTIRETVTVNIPVGTSVQYEHVSIGTTKITILESTNKDIVGKIYTSVDGSFGVIETDDGLVPDGNTLFRFTKGFPVESIHSDEECFIQSFNMTKADVKRAARQSFKKQLKEYEEKQVAAINLYVDGLFNDEEDDLSSLYLEEFEAEFEDVNLQVDKIVRIDAKFELVRRFDSGNMAIEGCGEDSIAYFAIPEDVEIELV